MSSTEASLGMTRFNHNRCSNRVDGDGKLPRSPAQAALQKKSREERFAKAFWNGTFLGGRRRLREGTDDADSVQLSGNSNSGGGQPLSPPPRVPRAGWPPLSAEGVIAVDKLLLQDEVITPSPQGSLATAPQEPTVNATRNAIVLPEDQIGSALPIPKRVMRLEKAISREYDKLSRLSCQYMKASLPIVKEMGEYLLAWKKAVGHGNQTDHLNALHHRTGVSPRTARNCMRIARDWKKLASDHGSDPSELSIRAALKLLGTGRRQNHSMEDSITGFELNSDRNTSDCTDDKSRMLATFSVNSPFGCVLLDPWGLSIEHNSQRHWTLSELSALPIDDVSEKDSHLFLLTDDDHLRDSMTAIARWGFSFQHSLILLCSPATQAARCWKTSHYFALGAARGDKPFSPTGLSSWLASQSDDAEQLRRRVELCSTGPYLQLFGSFERNPRGWSFVDLVEQGNRI